MFTSDSDKSIRSDFSSVTLSEDRLTTSSPPFSSLNTISSSELHASSPAAPPSSLAWGITSAGRAAVTATLVSGGGGSLWKRTPNTRVTAVHARFSSVVMLYKYYDYCAWRQPYRRRIVITAGSAHLSRRPAYGGRRRRNTTFVREPITHHHTIRHCDDAKRYPKFRRRHGRTENANEQRTVTTTKTGATIIFYNIKNYYFWVILPAARRLLYRAGSTAKITATTNVGTVTYLTTIAIFII